MQNIIFCICGPSGSGKSTLIDYLLKNYSDTFTYLPSVSSREMRFGEIQGDPYYFMSKSEFEEKIKDGDFIEYELQPHNNNYYGKSKSLLEKLDHNKIILAEMQIQKVIQFKNNLPNFNIFSFFLFNEDKEDLRSRLIIRGDKPQDIEKRLKIMTEEEIINKDKADYILPSPTKHIEVPAEKIIEILKNDFNISI